MKGEEEGEEQKEDDGENISKKLRKKLNSVFTPASLHLTVELIILSVEWNESKQLGAGECGNNPFRFYFIFFPMSINLLSLC